VRRVTTSPTSDLVESGPVLLLSPVRRALVDELARYRPDPDVDLAAPGLTAAQLAEVLDLHVTTVRFHLDQLVAAGVVTAEFTKVFGVGRPRKVYAVAPEEPRTEDNGASLHILAELLTESFGSRMTPVKAGEEWAAQHVDLVDEGPAESAGTWLTKVGRMIDVLQDWGYHPELSTTEGGRSCQIDLARCPFMDLARANEAVVCGIHRGIIKGVLRQLGESEASVSLEPFVEPDRCQAHIHTRTPFRGHAARHQES
jgi:predicted ArsR family transcriptional regulator